MEDRFVNKNKKHLVIGDFSIEISGTRRVAKAMIPFPGMAFYQPKEEKADMHLRLQAHDSIPEEERRQVWGSDEFSITTYLYENEEEQEWVLYNGAGEVMMDTHISRDWSDFTVSTYRYQDEGEMLFRQFGSLFAYAILRRDAGVFHGVVMEHEGRGILVMAASGVGKTTHTRLWRDHKNALILNGDRCLVRKWEDGWYAYGSPWSGSSGEYINRRVKITCIVCLHQDKRNHVTRDSEYQNAVHLMQRVFAPRWAGELQNKALDMCIEMAGSLPVLQLHCLPDVESTDVLLEAIRECEKENHG